MDQGRKVGYQPPPFDQTPCHLNQKNCTKVFSDSALGSNITLTYAWKHLIYEDFDRTLFQEWENNQTRPDYLFLSPGGHDCYHEPKVGVAQCTSRPSSPPHITAAVALRPDNVSLLYLENRSWKGNMQPSTPPAYHHISRYLSQVTGGA